ncbi:MAG: hypothetical protein AAF493_10735 [Pseudomonadota bacterium]
MGWSDRFVGKRDWPKDVEVHRYVPMPSHDPHLDDGAGPSIIVESKWRSKSGLTQWLEGVEFREAAENLPPNAYHDAFEVHFFVCAGSSEVRRKSAPISYVVRYYRPADDERGFVEHYLATHPAILGRLPAVQNVICYSPFSLPLVPGLTPSDCMLGNEVVFESLDALNAALASPVRDELRRDFHQFPAFTGINTHFAMQREQLR